MDQKRVYGVQRTARRYVTMQTAVTNRKVVSLSRLRYTIPPTITDYHRRAPMTDEGLIPVKSRTRGELTTSRQLYSSFLFRHPRSSSSRQLSCNQLATDPRRSVISRSKSVSCAQLNPKK